MKLLSFQKLLTLSIVLPISMIGIHSNAQAQNNPAAELAEMDAAAAMLGSIRSWVDSDPEAAIAVLENYEQIRQYVDQKHAQYAGANGRSADRVKAIESGIKTWEEFLAKYHAKQPRQIATELKRQRDAVLRYKKSKSPRPVSFAYIPKTVWKTKDRLDVLTASGADTKDLQAEQEEVQTMVLDLLATLDVEIIAKKNGLVRDAYKNADRSSIEAVVTQQWKTANPDQAIAKIVMPKSSWSHTYSARFDKSSRRVVPDEVDRMTIYVATRKSDGVLTLNPIRLMRENQKVNGKRLGVTSPQSATAISTNEFPFDVLEKNIR